MTVQDHVILFLHLAALAGYVGAWGIFLRGYREGDTRRSGTGALVAAGSAAVHLAALGVFALVHRALPLVGLGPASSTLGLAIVVLALVAAFLREEARAAMLFVMPLTLLLVGEAVAVGLDPALTTGAFRGPWFVAHVGMAFVGYAGLALASAAAFMYVLQFRSLKHKDFGRAFGFLPPLDTLDGLNRTGLAVGFPALTLGLIAGWSWTLTYGRGWEFGNPQVIFGVLTWVVYLGAVVARLAPGGRGERASHATVAAFLLTAATFLLFRLLGAGGPAFL